MCHDEEADRVPITRRSCIDGLAARRGTASDDEDGHHDKSVFHHSYVAVEYGSYGLMRMNLIERISPIKPGVKRPASFGSATANGEVRHAARLSPPGLRSCPASTYPYAFLIRLRDEPSPNAGVNDGNSTG